ncbi:MAG: SHOCT domain-containing protein [Oscillospiraceae bacterium]|nr:SHOCT domain-containing protein [Oscillospiraceae bacterium]
MNAKSVLKYIIARNILINLLTKGLITEEEFYKIDALNAQKCGI